MANSKIVIVEGPQGVGKTTITDFLRHSMKYTNLYRLSGTSDSSKEGLKKSKIMYENLLNYMKTLEMSHEVTLEECRSVKLPIRIMRAFLNLFSPMM